MKRPNNNKFKKLFNEISIYIKAVYYIQVNSKAIVKKNGSKWIYFSYITKPIRRKHDSVYFKGHQNRRETLIVEQIFNELNLSYVFENYDKEVDSKKKDFDIVFGIEPNFEKVAKLNNKSLKIYYATGCYFKHQNNTIIQRTDEFREKYSTDYPYERLVDEHDSCEIADCILQIGSSHTLESYPAHLKNKITLIHQSSHNFDHIDIEDKKNKLSNKDYIWFGSQGAILKGLDLVVEAFINKPSLNLHIVGPVDDEFIYIYKNTYNSASNINFYGFINIDSSFFRELVNKCTFLIFPSGSEGGPSGSVINLQKLGVIPILSYWASDEETKNLGYVLNNLSVESIDDAIIWSQSLSNYNIYSLVKANHKYASETYNIERFKNEFCEFLKALTDNSN